MSGIGQSLMEVGQRGAMARLLASHVLENPIGKIFYVPGAVTIYTLEDAVARLHDLHLRAWLAPPILTLDKPLQPHLARSQYRLGATALIAQASSLPPGDAAKFLDAFLSAVEKLGSTGGLEPIFVTAVLATPPDDYLVVDALARWLNLDFDGRVGGNQTKSVAFNPVTKGFVEFTPERLNEVLQVSGQMRDLRSRIAARFEQCSISEKQCIGFFEFVGQVAGAGIGWKIGKGAGAIIGADQGMKAGKSLGSAVCPSISKQDPPEHSNDGGGEGAGNGNDGEGGAETDDPDHPPMDGDNTEGCIVNPDWDFHRPDPYRKFATSVESTYFTAGKGLLAYAAKQGGYTRVDVDAITTSLYTNVRDELVDKLSSKSKLNAKDRRRDVIVPAYESFELLHKPLSADSNSPARVKDLQYAVEIEGEYQPVVDSSGNPVLGNDGQPMTTFIPTSQTVVFPPGSAGAVRFPRGIKFGPNDSISPGLVKLLIGRSDIDGTNPNKVDRVVNG